jgi:hypothetical protein
LLLDVLNVAVIVMLFTGNSKFELSMEKDQKINYDVEYLIFVGDPHL